MLFAVTVPRGKGGKSGIARCPQCEAVAEHGNANPWRPFCSKRCKLLDLEGWFTERHVIPGESEDWAPPDSDDGRRH